MVIWLFLTGLYRECSAMWPIIVKIRLRSTLDHDCLTPLSFAQGRTFRNKEARNGGRKAVDLIHTENQGRTAIPWRT
jgi:hypothetical protein